MNDVERYEDLPPSAPDATAEPTDKEPAVSEPHADYPANPAHSTHPVVSLDSANRRAVRRVQQLLSKHGFAVSVTGVFDADTEEAVADFQASANLDEDGVVDDETWAALLK